LNKQRPGRKRVIGSTAKCEGVRGRLQSLMGTTARQATLKTAAGWAGDARERRKMNPAASPARGETLAGNVAVTTTDPIYMSGVSEMIDAFQERRPARRINLSVTTRRLLRADTFIAIAGTCRLGRGVAMLPKAYTVRMPDLVPPDHLMDAPHAAGLWLLAHPDLRNNPRARAFLDFFGKRLSKEKKHFAG
jgi:DNA-binding transcriptional LysR family regulator